MRFLSKKYELFRPVLSLEIANESNFSENGYRNANPDVDSAIKQRKFSSGVEHFEKFGKAESRLQETVIGYVRNLPHNMNREKLSSKIDSSMNRILEIGPLNRPVSRKHDTKYFDLQDRMGLRSICIAKGLDPETVPEITYVHDKGNLNCISEKFEAVVSAHCLEHQPDLIAHLNSVERVFDKNQTRDQFYFLLLPDHRYCFDHFLRPSTILEIIEAHKKSLRMPSESKILEHNTLVTHNDPVRHWNGDHGYRFTDFKNRLLNARSIAEKGKSEYIDVHCWQFTPESFVELIYWLNQLNYTRFSVAEVFETPKLSLEFVAILKLEKN